nr:hypothetical protein [Tanacetum cinerariifolium]
IGPWTFVQKLGDGVLIPVGCGHQVRNLKYKRELVMVYLSNVEQICKRFVKEKRGSLGKLIEDKTKWSKFWVEGGGETSFCRFISKEKSNSILKLAMKQFFVEKEVAFSLVMYIAYLKKGNFILVDDVLALLQTAAVEPLPPKDDKGSQNCTKMAAQGMISARNLLNVMKGVLLKWDVEPLNYLSFHIYSGVVALKRQEELIREEEAEWMTGFEQKTKWGASEKNKKSKKKQLDWSQCTFKGLDDDRLSQWYHRCWKMTIGSSLSSLQSLDVSYCRKLIFPDCQKFIQLLEKFEEGFKNTGLPDKHDYDKGKVSRDIAKNSIFKGNELLGANVDEDFDEKYASKSNASILAHNMNT